MIVLRGVYPHVEKVFYCLLGLLSVSLISIAIWSGPSPLAAAKGIVLFSVPDQTDSPGSFDGLLIVISLIGAVGSSTANLLYPYFIQQKGWIGPQFRRLQMYDLLFGTLILLVLDLSVWIVGAELLKPRGIVIHDLADLARLLTEALGKLGEPLFFVGVFAALYSSVIGAAVGHGYLWDDLMQIIRPQTDEACVQSGGTGGKTRVYTFVVVWCLFSPLVWSLPDMPGFIILILVGNAASVLVLPILSASLWYITARKHCIGSRFRNRLWENLIIGRPVGVGGLGSVSVGATNCWPIMRPT